MFWWPFHTNLILTAVALVGLVEGRQEDVEMQVFAAAISALSDELRKDSHFDPHPVRIGETWPKPEDYYVDATAEAATRLKVLKRLGLRTVRAFPIPRDCDPLMYPPDDRKVTRGCPERTDIAFDRIRRSAQPDRWIIRRMSMDYGQGGFARGGRSAEIWEMMIARRAGEYVLVGDSLIIQID